VARPTVPYAVHVMSVLSDTRLVVRPWRRTDATALHAAAEESMEEVWPWLERLDTIESLPDAETWMVASENHWRSATEYRFGIFERDQPDRCLGGINLQRLERIGQVATLDGWVRTPATGSGIATDAARLVARFGLTTAEFDRIDLLVATGNLAAARVAAKLGAQPEGLMRRRLRLRGQYVPAQLHWLTRLLLAESLS
jgi:RimJ/RimL family protein N-acetyltransferase